MSKSKMESTFTNIYDKKKWGSKNGKGCSSTSINTSPDTRWYIKTLMQHISNTDSKTICDLGCGDWDFSKTIDWSGLHYTGMDCVKSVIEYNQKCYSSGNITFKHQDALSIPEGFDFVILKDVIQHWQSDVIVEVLPQIIKKNKYVFLGNGYMFGRDRTKNNWRTRTLDKVYHYHPVDISKSPLCDMNLNMIDIQHRRCKQFILISSASSLEVS